MKTIKIEQTKNGFIVRTNYYDERGVVQTQDDIYVFQTKRALNKFINDNFIFEDETKN